MNKYLITIFSLIAFLLSAGFIFADQSLAQRLSGWILLQVESHGEAWYVNPGDNKKYYLGRPADALNIMRNLGLGATHDFIVGYTAYPDHVLGKILIDVDDYGKAYYIYPKDKKRYYLGKPGDAFAVMKQLGLGITNANLNKITVGSLTAEPASQASPTSQFCECQINSPDKTISGAASAIRSGNVEQVKFYFTEDMQKAAEYTMNFLDNDGRLALGNILSGSRLSNSTDDKKIYTAEVYFNGEIINVIFRVKKQEDGTWLMANL
ncbi:hypothetical protein L6249_03030 [Candidatus Parcubacteria bacterium]|nr:hypothetical protein [Candidatus Parcubacteria bacterium]